MTLGDFLNNQASKLGLQQDKALIDLLSNSQMASIQMDEELAKSLDNGLLSLESAKNNYGLKNHFSATALNGVDAELLKDLALDEETKKAIQAETNSYKRIALVKSALQNEINRLKEGGGSNTKKEEYEKQIRDLNEQTVQLKDDHDKAIEGLKANHSGEIQNFMFTNMLSGKSFANTNVTVEDNITFSRSLIDSALKEKGAIIVNEGGKLVLKQENSPELDYYQDNKPVTLGAFTDGVLASKKMLAVNNSGGNQAPNTSTAPVNIPGTVQQNTSGFENAIGAALGK